MAIEYQFKYMPLIGKLPGKSMAEQTETAINEIAQIVNENTAQAEIINTLAQEANENSVEALEKATEALETSGRVYIKETTAVNLNSYCESQLIYIGNVSSTNLPVLSKGFLEVKTNDDKSQATQVFVDDTDRNIYVRTGAITATTVGDVTTYTASYGDWVQMGTKAEIDLKAPIDSPTFTGTPTAPTPSANDNSTKIATTAYVQGELPAVVDVDETNASGNYYNTSVPSGKVFSNFNTIGGKTIAWTQLFDPTVNTSGSISGRCTWSKNADGTMVFLGDNTATSVGSTNIANITQGHKYAILGWTNTNGIQLYDGDNPLIVTDGVYSANTSSIYRIRTNSISIPNGTTVTLKPKIADLTLLFGSGNEPSTLADFLAMFPNFANASYNAGTLLSAGTDKVISKDSSNNVVATMPIPASVQSLDGYGWSAGTVYNYVDFENKKFVQNVGRVDLGSWTWAYYSAGQYFYPSTNLPNIKYGVVNQYPNLLMPKYDLEQTQERNDLSYTVATDGALVLKDTSFNGDTTNFKSAMSGVYLYYELDIPIETDISDLLGADGIACESGGSLTFENSNGDNYRLPVPVNLDWLDGTDGLMTVQDKAKLDMIYEYIQRLGL